MILSFKCYFEPGAPLCMIGSMLFEVKFLLAPVDLWFKEEKQENGYHYEGQKIKERIQV